MMKTKIQQLKIASLNKFLNNGNRSEGWSIALPLAVFGVSILTGEMSAQTLGYVNWNSNSLISSSPDHTRGYNFKGNNDLVITSHDRTQNPLNWSTGLTHPETGQTTTQSTWWYAGGLNGGPSDWRATWEFEQGLNSDDYFIGIDVDGSEQHLLAAFDFDGNQLSMAGWTISRNQYIYSRAWEPDSVTYADYLGAVTGPWTSLSGGISNHNPQTITDQEIWLSPAPGQNVARIEFLIDGPGGYGGNNEGGTTPTFALWSGGTVIPVPEPDAAMLIGLAGLMSIIYRRR